LAAAGEQHQRRRKPKKNRLARVGYIAGTCGVSPR
jgi:hypothetical protein